MFIDHPRFLEGVKVVARVIAIGAGRNSKLKLDFGLLRLGFTTSSTLRVVVHSICSSRFMGRLLLVALN